PSTRDGTDPRTAAYVLDLDALPAAWAELQRTRKAARSRLIAKQHAARRSARAVKRRAEGKPVVQSSGSMFDDEADTDVDRVEFDLGRCGELRIREDWP